MQPRAGSDVSCREPVHNVYDAVLKTPIGLIGVFTFGRSVTRIDLQADHRIPVTAARPGETASAVLDWLNDYFRNPSIALDLPLQPAGTAYQQRVWAQLRRIPCGRVLNYGELARSLNSSARAVGQACRRNPLPILIPCHRVVAKGGLGGFMGAERALATKRWLLEHEAVL